MNADINETRNFDQATAGRSGAKIQRLAILLTCILLAALVTMPNVLKYLDPGAGSFLLQAVMGITSCTICGIPVALIGALIYYFTKGRRNNS
ncbi:MAG: hypothetical protein IT314_17450 [Anaerolineales bacterium]|nr:hypothetical protein [Anaerolineales bacterium]